MTAGEFLTLEAIDQLIGEPRPLRHPYVGVQAICGIAMILFNRADGSTKAWIVYSDDSPVVISYRGAR